MTSSLYDDTILNMQLQNCSVMDNITELLSQIDYELMNELQQIDMKYNNLFV